MGVAELIDPLVLEACEQLASAQLKRLFEPFVLDVVTERGSVDPDIGTAEATRSRVASNAPLASTPSDRRIAQIAFRRLARALESSTSGQKRAATSAR